MTAWASERAAIENMIDAFGDGFFACVMDSYDYAAVRRWHMACLWWGAWLWVRC